MLSYFRVFVIALVLIVAAATPGWATVLTAVMRTPYFIVHYDPSDRALAESTADTAQKELVRISGALGYTIEAGRPIPLKVYRAHYDFIKEGGIKDRFTVGIARTGDETISIDASGTFVTVRQVLAHEITHAVIFRVLGPNAFALPLWVNEGIAKYESESYSGNDDAIMADSASHDELIPLAELRTSFPSDRSSLAYAESWSAIRYMIKQHGESAPRLMLAELAWGSSFDAAMTKATGKDENGFVRDWTSSLSRRFNPLRTWQIASAFLWPIVAALAVLAFLIRRKRMRDAARQWDWEEFEDSMERQLRERPHR